MESPITKRRNEYDRLLVSQNFPELVAGKENNCLSLRKHLNNIPERYFDNNIYSEYLKWFIQRNALDKRKFKEYLSSDATNISKAFQFLRQINEMDIHDDSLTKGNEYDLIKIIDNTIHPIYLRLVEAVFSILIKPIAYFSRIDRKKPTDGLDVYNLVEEILSSSMALCISSYSHIIRNGIAHSGIKYLQNSIMYTDKKGNSETFDLRSVIQIFDSMIDSCNAMVAALRVFFLINKHDYPSLPFGFALEELIEQTRSPWWKIEGSVENEISQGRQLIIYAIPNTIDKFKVSWASFQTAVLCESLASGYDRYFISFRSKKCSPGWAIFEGQKIKEIREAGATNLEGYIGALQSDLGFFFIPKYKIPKIFLKYDTLLNAIRLSYSLILCELDKNVMFKRLFTKNNKIHRNSWGVVLSGDVIIEGLTKEALINYIKTKYRKIIKVALISARSQKRILEFEKYMPLGYARVSVYRRMLRARKMYGYGLDEDLVCTIQIKKIKRIQAPDIYQSTIEEIGNYRIAWNKKWIETV